MTCAPRLHAFIHLSSSFYETKKKKSQSDNEPVDTVGAGEEGWVLRVCVRVWVWRGGVEGRCVEIILKVCGFFYSFFCALEPKKRYLNTNAS